jgi:hypothetical protein
VEDEGLEDEVDLRSLFFPDLVEVRGEGSGEDEDGREREV